MKKTKLVVGISDFRIGGAQKLVVDVLNRIDLNAFDVTLVVLVQYDTQETFYDRIAKEVKVHKLQFKSFKDVASWKQLFLLLKAIKPDVVWSSLYLANTIFRVLGMLLRFKVVATEQNTYLSKTVLQKSVDFILALFTHKIVAVSDYVANFTAKQELIPLKKFQVIYNGVDTTNLNKEARLVDRADVFRELNISSDCKLVLNIGQFIYQKNQALLLEAFKKFSNAHPNYRLLILGEGTQRENLEKLAMELNIVDKVMMPGIKKNVSRYYAVSDFFVLSSRFEGFPVVIVEALACGLPIVSTPVSGSSEYLANGSNGFLVEPNVDSLFEGMCKVAELSAEEKQSQKNHSLQIARRFDIAHVTKQYETLFLSS